MGAIGEPGRNVRKLFAVTCLERPPYSEGLPYNEGPTFAPAL